MGAWMCERVEAWMRGWGCLDACQLDPRGTQGAQQREAGQGAEVVVGRAWRCGGVNIWRCGLELSEGWGQLSVDTHCTTCVTRRCEV